MEYLGLFVLAGAFTAVCTLLVRAVALRRGFLDHPAHNKPHVAATPTLGGLAIAGPFFALLWGVHVLRSGPLSISELAGLTAAGLLVVALGTYDDLYGCNALKKFLVQIIAALMLYGSGFRIEQVTNPFDDAVKLSLLGPVLTILWVVGITNAVNLIDGMDGLASGVVLTASVTLFIIAVRFGEASVVLPALLLAGSLLGFLPHNLPPARIFLGDTGSLFLGFTIAAISLLHNRKGTLTITLLLPVVLLAFPILDTSLAFFRRVFRLRHPFRGDAEHLHHRLLRLGFTPYQVLALFYSLSLFLSLVAFLLTFMPKRYTMLAVAALALCLLSMLWALSYQQRKASLRGEGAPSPAPAREGISGTGSATARKGG